MTATLTLTRTTRPDSNRPLAAPTTPPAPAPAHGYHPGLDGLRAIAVTLVLAYHLGILDGGRLGVDLFFVLSGWLITSKLLTELHTGGTIQLRRFWGRRCRRLIPAAVTVTAATTGTLTPGIARDSLWAAAWASNWGTITGGGDYWAAGTSPLIHMWSLAVEEQFYLIWPALLLLTGKVTRRHVRVAVGALAATGTIASVIVMNDLHTVNLTAAYMSTFARAQGLLIGAAAACITTRHTPTHGVLRRTTRTAGWAATVICATIIAAANDPAPWLFRGGFTVFSIAACMLVVTAGPGQFGGRWLGARAPRWLAARSYGLYLWHWPVFVMLTDHRLNLLGLPASVGWVARLTVSFAVTELSYRAVERPVMAGRCSARKLAGLTVLAVTVIAVTAAAFTTPPATPPEWRAQNADVMIIGDSVIWAAMEQLITVGYERGYSVQPDGHPGCAPTDNPAQQVWVPQDCAAQMSAIPARIADINPTRIVWWWGGHGDGRYIGAGQPAIQACDDPVGYAALTDFFMPMSAGRPASVVLPPVAAGDPDAVELGCERAVVAAQAARYGIDVIDLQPVLDALPDARPDGTHWEGDGATAAATAIFDALTHP